MLACYVLSYGHTHRASSGVSSVKHQIGSIGSIVYMVTLLLMLGNGEGSILKHHYRLAFEFSRNYTKLALLSFLYCFVVKGKLI